jgi:hypothetical protein
VQVPTVQSVGAETRIPQASFSVTGVEVPLQVKVVSPVLASIPNVPTSAPDPSLRVIPLPDMNAAMDAVIVQQGVVPIFPTDVMLLDASIVFAIVIPLE